MDINLNKLQRTVDTTDSIIEIQNMINSENTVDVSKIQIHKCFSSSRNFISLSLTSRENVWNADIICSYDNMKPVLMHLMKKAIILEDEINIEHVTCVGVEIMDDTKSFSEQNKSILAKRYAGFISFLINSYPNAKKLKLMLNDRIKSNNNFLIYLLEKIKSDKIEVIETLNLHDIIKYGELYNLSQSFMFRGTPCLKKVIIQVSENECYECILRKNTSIIHKFINRLSIFSLANLHLIVNDNDKSRIVMDEIFNYSEAIAMTTSVSLRTDWCSGIIKNNYKFNDNSIRLINYLKMVNFSVEEESSIEKLKVILSYCKNLKYLEVIVDNERLYQIWGKLYNTDFMSLCLGNFTSSIKELSSLTICTKKSNCDKDLDEFTIEFMESFIKIFPHSIYVLLLKNIKTLSVTFFENISNNFYGLETMLFSNITNIPVDSCFKIYGLKNVIIYNNVTLLIPHWINVVIFCDRDINKWNEYYFNKMRSFFNVSIRKNDKKGNSFVAFLRSIHYWKYMLELVNKYISN